MFFFYKKKLGFDIIFVGVVEFNLFIFVRRLGVEQE